MNNLKETIKEMKKIRTEEKLKISDEILFDGSLRVYISNKISNEKYPSKNNATPLQLMKLTELKVTIPKNLTRDMADKIIFKCTEKK